MNILVILTSHDKLDDTGKKTGFWLEEMASPYYVLKDAGTAMTLAWPKGGSPPIELTPAATDTSPRFAAELESLTTQAQTCRLGEIDITDFDAIFYRRGNGPLWDLAKDSASVA
jgi:putative intracellular protease/amidase